MVRGSSKGKKSKVKGGKVEGGEGKRASHGAWAFPNTEKPKNRNTGLSRMARDEAFFRHKEHKEGLRTELGLFRNTEVPKNRNTVLGVCPHRPRGGLLCRPYRARKDGDAITQCDALGWYGAHRWCWER